MSMLSSFAGKHFFDLLMKELVHHEPEIQMVLLKLVDSIVEHFSKALKDKIQGEQ